MTQTSFSFMESEPGYLGCYPADGSQFQPTLSLTSSAGSDSVDDCLTLCRSENKSFAAMSGRNCHCSSQLPSNISSSKVTDDECSTACSGNSRQICGGPKHYSGKFAFRRGLVFLFELSASSKVVTP